MLALQRFHPLIVMLADLHATFGERFDTLDELLT